LKIAIHTRESFPGVTAKPPQIKTLSSSGKTTAPALALIIKYVIIFKDPIKSAIYDTCFT